MSKSYWLIGGSRDFTDKKKFAEVMHSKLAPSSLFRELVIVSGGCRGVDTMASEFAKSHGIAMVEFLPDWKKYGRAAGPKRNDEMVAFMVDKKNLWNETNALFFWDGESKGTKQCIASAKKAGLQVYIYNTKTGETEAQ